MRDTYATDTRSERETLKVRTTPQASARSTGREASTEWTRRLLACGIVAGPFMVVVSFIQAVTRSGYDLSRHPISMLLLGDLGWIQLINFELTGLLAIAFAVGMRRVLRSSRGGTWGPRLVGAFGAGLIVAGLFGPDAGFGFPPGAPEGMPTMSTHGALHAVGFFVSMVSLLAACFVFRRRFAALGHRGWAVYCAATGIAIPALVVLSMAMVGAGNGVVLFGLLVIISAWLSIVAARLLAERRSTEW